MEETTCNYCTVSYGIRSLGVCKELCVSIWNRLQCDCVVLRCELACSASMADRVSDSVDDSPSGYAFLLDIFYHISVVVHDPRR